MIRPLVKTDDHKKDTVRYSRPNKYHGLHKGKWSSYRQLEASPEAVGYKLYFGTSSGNDLNASTGIDIGKTSSFTFRDVQYGKHYISLKTYNSFREL